MFSLLPLQQLVRSAWSSCHLSRPVFIFKDASVRSSPHILWQWLILPLTSYLLRPRQTFVSTNISSSFTDHSRQIKSLLTCSCNDNVCDSWKRYETSFWMSIKLTCVWSWGSVSRKHEVSSTFMSRSSITVSTSGGKAACLTRITVSVNRSQQKENISNINSNSKSCDLDFTSLWSYCLHTSSHFQ